METVKGIKVYIFRSGETMNKTFVIADDIQDAVKKFFNTFTDIRSAVLNNEISQKFIVESGSEKTQFSSIPFLILLDAISREEAIHSLMPYIKNRDVCEKEINKAIQKCQWIINSK